jgi:PKHD-type hydroxylase
VYNQISNFPYQRAFAIQPFISSVDFTPEEVARMNAMFSQDILTPAPLIEGRVNENARISDVKFYYPEEDNFWIFEKLNFIIDSSNQHVWNFDLNGYDSFQYTEYRASQGGKYDFHTDIDYTGGNSPDPQTRKLSLSLFLNEPGVDYEGGEFQMLVGSQPMSIKQTAGGVLLFPSWVVHRVTPVTRGVRKSLVVWVTGPKFR